MHCSGSAGVGMDGDRWPAGAGALFVGACSAAVTVTTSSLNRLDCVLARHSDTGFAAFTLAPVSFLTVEGLALPLVARGSSMAQQPQPSIVGSRCPELGAPPPPPALAALLSCLGNRSLPNP